MTVVLGLFFLVGFYWLLYRIFVTPFGRAFNDYPERFSPNLIWDSRQSQVSILIVSFLFWLFTNVYWASVLTEKSNILECIIVALILGAAIRHTVKISPPNSERPWWSTVNWATYAGYLAGFGTLGAWAYVTMETYLTKGWCSDLYLFVLGAPMYWAVAAALFLVVVIACIAQFNFSLCTCFLSIYVAFRNLLVNGVFDPTLYFENLADLFLEFSKHGDIAGIVYFVFMLFATAVKFYERGFSSMLEGDSVPS